MEDNHFDKTEDFSEIMDDVNETTENFDTTIDELSEKLDREMSDISREVHINDFNDDFMGLVRKRDYKGKEEDSPLPSRSSKRRKLKKWVYLVLLLAIIGIGVSVFLIIQNNKQRKLEEEKAIIDNIKSHYHEVAKVSKDTDLYEKKNDEFSKIGTIYKDTNISLVEEEITLDTKYFHIKDMDYYIPFEDVQEGIIEEQDTRYKNYLPFNLNIVTKDSFTMYQGDKKLISIDKEMEFPIIINNYDDKYYVEYNNMLVSISKDDVKNTKESKNTDKKNQSKMTTLAYHRIYKPENSCTDAYVCMKIDNFDKQMKYLVDNNYFTLTLEEFYMYLKGNLQVEKGIMITLDDGLLFVNADEVLDKYQLKATGFVTTSLGTIYKGLKAIYVQSHTHDMHRNYVCPGGNQGGALLCASKTKIIEDLKKSIELLGTDPIAFAYPFYDYNDNVIVALKEAGYKMAFVGRAGVLGKATPKVTDLYKIPRMTVYDEKAMSFNEWKGYL
jgi:hypothetical protein